MLVRAHGTDTVKRHVECLQNVMSMGRRPPKEALVGLDPALCTVGGIGPNSTSKTDWVQNYIRRCRPMAAKISKS